MNKISHRNIAIAIIVLIFIGLVVRLSTKDNYAKTSNKNKNILTGIITDVVEQTNLNNKYKDKAKALLYNIVKRLERSISAEKRKKRMSPSKSAAIILKENRRIINRSNGKIKKIVVIGNIRYIIGENDKIIKTEKIKYESYSFGGEYSNWDYNISIGEEVEAPGNSYACVGQEGPNPLCPDFAQNCCYGPTNPPQGICMAECEDDLDTFISGYLPALLTTLGTALIASWAAGILVGGGFLIIGIALVVIAVALLIQAALERSDTSISDLWDIIKESVSSIFDSAKINRPYEEDNLLEESPLLDETTGAIIVSQDDNVDNIVVDYNSSGNTGVNGSDGYISINNRGIPESVIKPVIDMIALPGQISDIQLNCDNYRNESCLPLIRQPNESRQEHATRVKCCLTPRNPILRFTTPPLFDSTIDSTNDLPPPPPSGGDAIRCEERCYNGYPGTVCLNELTGEIVSETWSSYQNLARCCRNECINDIWHTVCPPHPGIDTETSCDRKQPKL